MAGQGSWGHTASVKGREPGEVAASGGGAGYTMGTEVGERWGTQGVQGWGRGWGGAHYGDGVGVHWVGAGRGGAHYGDGGGPIVVGGSKGGAHSGSERPEGAESSPTNFRFDRLRPAVSASGPFPCLRPGLGCQGPTGVPLATRTWFHSGVHGPGLHLGLSRSPGPAPLGGARLADAPGRPRPDPRPPWVPASRGGLGAPARDGRAELAPGRMEGPRLLERNHTAGEGGPGSAPRVY